MQKQSIQVRAEITNSSTSRLSAKKQLSLAQEEQNAMVKKKATIKKSVQSAFYQARKLSQECSLLRSACQEDMAMMSKEIGNDLVQKL